MSKLLKASAILGALLFAASCDSEKNSMSDAERIARQSIIIDTHIDVPYRLFDKMENVAVATETGDFDYPRALEGGLNAAFMSIYIPAAMEAEGTATAHADGLIDLVENIVNQAPDKFALAYSVSDIRSNFEKGLVSLPMGMENGAPVAGDLNNLKHFYDRGIRYITLTHSLANHISDSSYDKNHPWGGLSPFGEQVVEEMNNLGIMVDVSHISDEAFWDVMAITKTPVIASHSSARFFTPGFERNMSDEMIVALAENGGVIQINFGSSFLTEKANGYGPKFRAAYDAYVEANGLEKTDETRDAFKPIFEAENGAFPFATLDETLDHFDHVIKLVGIDHVGVGSDYDGVGDSLPIGLKSVAAYPNLIQGLLKRGYSEGDIKKILGENVLRVWSQVEAYAAED